MFSMTKDNLCVCGENHCGCGDDVCFFCDHDGPDVFDHDSVQLACDQGNPPVFTELSAEKPEELK